MSVLEPWPAVAVVGERVYALGALPAGELLLYGGLAHGLGSSALPLDRGGPGETQLIRLEHRGDRVAVVALARDQGVGGLPHDAASEGVERAFGVSVLAILPVLAEREADSLGLGTAGPIVDLTPLAVADVFDIAGTLSHGGRSIRGPLPDAVPYRLEPAHSALVADAIVADERGLLLAAALGFVTAQRPPAALRAVLPDARSVGVEQRIVIRRRPDGYEPLDHHPRSGSYGKRRQLHTRTTDDRALAVLQPRFRPHEPVVFTVDPGIPEPYRSAVVEGASWWAEAFAAAEHAGTFSVTVGDDGAEPWAIGTHPIWWVHRAERGWSMGHAVTDPVTGEIVRGSVRLGAQRVAQLRRVFEAVLAPFGDPDEPLLLHEIEQALQARLRQLAAHETGHALGFVHNYASDVHDRPSVMDYPHARFDLDERGRPRLREPYPRGLGDWDRFVVDHAYASPERRRRLRAEGRLSFLADADGHGPGASAAGAVPWTLPRTPEARDELEALAHIVRVRDRARRRFGVGAAPPDATFGELENRYGIVHLLHRFEVVRVARLLGGVDYGYGLVGELAEWPDLAPATVAAPTQHRALEALVALLEPDVVTVPEAALRWLLPASIRHDRGTSAVSEGRTGPLADPDAYEAAALSLVVAEMLDPARWNRLDQQHARDAGVPSPHELALALGTAAGRGGQARRVVVAHALDALASGRAHPASEEEIAALVARLDPVRLRRFEERGERPALPEIPAGAPL